MRFYFFLWAYIIPVIICLLTAAIYEKFKGKIKFFDEIEAVSYPFNPIFIFMFIAFVPILNIRFCFELLKFIFWVSIGFVFGFFDDKDSNDNESFTK